MRKVGRRPPLSLMAGGVSSLVTWNMLLTMRAVLPPDIADRLVLPQWGGVLVFAAIASASVWWTGLTGQYWLSVDRHGCARVAKKQFWQRLRDHHVLMTVDAASLKLSDDDPWWRATTTVIDGDRYAVLVQRSALARSRQTLANPHKPPPPLY